MSKKQSDKKVITVRLTEEEKQKLEYCSNLCGLSQSEFISKGQWALTLPSETAERQSPIRPKCRRVYGTGLSRFKRRAISTGCICTKLLRQCKVKNSFLFSKQHASTGTKTLFAEANEIFSRYSHFYNYERIRIKIKLTPLQKRRQLA